MPGAVAADEVIVVEARSAVDEVIEVASGTAADGEDAVDEWVAVDAAAVQTGGNPDVLKDPEKADASGRRENNLDAVGLADPVDLAGLVAQVTVVAAAAREHLRGRSCLWKSFGRSPTRSA